MKQKSFGRVWSRFIFSNRGSKKKMERFFWARKPAGNFHANFMGHAHNFKVLIPPFDILTKPGLYVTI